MRTFYLLTTFHTNMTENFDGLYNLELARMRLASRRIKLKLQN